MFFSELSFHHHSDMPLAKNIFQDFALRPRKDRLSVEHVIISRLQ